MPGMDGVEAISFMRSEPSLQSTQVIAIVSREMAEEEMQRLTSSIDAVSRGHRARVRATAEILRESAGSMAPA